MSCMGGAMSTAQDKPSSAANGKGSFVTRLRRKFNIGGTPKHHAASTHKDTTSTTTRSTTTTATNNKAESTTEPPADASTWRRTKPMLGRMATMQALKRQQSERRERLKPVPDPPRRSDILRNGLPPVQSQSLGDIVEAPDSPVPSARPFEPFPAPEAAPPTPVYAAGTDSGELIARVPPSPSPSSIAAAAPFRDEGDALRSPVSPVSPVSPLDAPLADDARPHSKHLMTKEIEDEMAWRWILNLSMHFRDESNREKFFVTYAQDETTRRRLSISCDYRDAAPGSLEEELSRLRLQRDKSSKIYEAIRDSLQDILFYDTITNLKLQTSDGRLHVHVTEDVNEIIHFPSVSTIRHLDCPKYRECDLVFDSHLSGFVYKVKVNGHVMIKKEIPGPETIDEFLYEIHALNALADSQHVIQFGGCVLDDTGEKVKGLLIAFAPKGALIDIVYNDRGNLAWHTRERWAKQIAAGLSEIHEAGYVQGDFTLSNIVIDDNDDAKIIDINRRGCPVGWEPPEVTAMIEGLQRIGMYIGVKSDIFQLGMVLWGLAHEQDEPEIYPRPLTMDRAPDDVPPWFARIVEACLCDKPEGRPSAKDICTMFPERIDDPPQVVAGTDAAGKPLPTISKWGELATLSTQNVQTHTQDMTPTSPPAHIIDASPSSTTSVPPGNDKMHFSSISGSTNLDTPGGVELFEERNPWEERFGGSDTTARGGSGTPHGFVDAKEMQTPSQTPV